MREERREKREGEGMKRINYADLYTLRKDGRYQGSYTDGRGRHYVYDRDPEKLYERLQRAATREEVVTFSEVAESWEREHRGEITERTWKNYEPHVRDICRKHGARPIEEMEAADVLNDLTVAKSKGYSATVVNTRRCIYLMIFDHAIIRGELKYNPAKSVKLPKNLKRGRRRGPTVEQMQIIVKNVEEPFGLFPFFLLCTGMRKSEALALDWSDIDLVAREIHVTKSLDYSVGARPKVKAPKTEAGNRMVPILDVLLPHLKGGSGPVFPGEKSNRGGGGGGYMTERGYEGAWQRYCEAVGLMEGGKPALTAHNIRHGTATLMYESGVDELTTQRILGHSRIEITRDIYTDLRAEQKMKSVEKLNGCMSRLMSESI